MSVIELKSARTFEFKIDDQIIKVRQPSMSELNKFQVALKDEKDEIVTVNKITDFIASLGFPKNIYESLPLESSQQVLKVITGEGKN